MAVKYLTPLEVRLGIKRGYSSTDFQDKFGYTPEELEAFIIESFGTNANRTIRSLHTNNKRAKRQTNPTSDQVSPPPAALPTPTLLVPYPP